MRIPNFSVARVTATLLCAAGLVNGNVRTGRPGHGLIGYGIKMYDPICAHACVAAVPKILECPDAHDMEGMEDMDMGPSPECLATNQPFLQSLAWCIHTHCDTRVANLAKLENWWAMNVAGRQVHQPVPNISYQTAVEQVETPPTEVLGKDEVLNRTVKVDDESYQANYNIYLVSQQIAANHSKYGLVVFITGAVIPIGLSLTRLIPLPSNIVSRFNAFFIDPPVFGSRHATPLWGFAIAPTRGQALFILYLVSINVIACAVGIRAIMPQPWFETSWYQVVSYVANRAGVVSFANIPLLILYSGRNNILLWLTNWSHSTFLLIHRWIAWICTLQACIHAALYLGLNVWQKAYAEASQTPFWHWGIIATLTLFLLLPMSILPIRRAMYEVFLIAHIILAIAAIVGSWYHIITRYDRQWGYETWLYMAMAIWAFDRLARLARIARKGLHRAIVSRVDDNYLRIEIPGVHCDGHVYAYFPSLTWRVWESHPFSVVNSICAVSSPPSRQSAGGDDTKTLDTKEDAITSTKEAGDSVASSETASVSGPQVGSRGTTLLVRTRSGLTSLLASKVGDPAGIPVLLEGSYGHESSSLLKASTAPTPEFPNTVCIAGGVGITAVLPSLTSTLRLYHPFGTTKLYWGVRHPGLVRTMEALIADSSMDEKSGKRSWNGIETHVTVGERMNLRDILEREVIESEGTTVIVCGHAGMADEVRCIVAALGRNGAIVRLVEESFTW